MTGAPHGSDAGRDLLPRPGQRELHTLPRPAARPARLIQQEPSRGPGQTRTTGLGQTREGPDATGHGGDDGERNFGMASAEGVDLARGTRSSRAAVCAVAEAT